MDFLATYTIDESGCSTVEKGKDEEEVKSNLTERIKKAYPKGVLTIISVEKHEKAEKVEKSDKKDGKDN